MMGGTQASRGMRPHDDDVTKARELTRLTRKPLSTMVDRVKIAERGAKGKIVRGGEPAERTHEQFDAIRVIAEEASRGGSIGSPGTVRRAEPALKIETIENEKARTRQGTRTDLTSSSFELEVEKEKARKRLCKAGTIGRNIQLGVCSDEQTPGTRPPARDYPAKKARLSPTTYHRAKATLEKGSPELIQRDYYTALEQAHAYRQAVDRYNAKGLSRGKAIRKLHENVNKTMDHIRDYLNLLDLPHDIQDRVHRKEISFSRARALIRLTRKPSRTTVVYGRSPDGRLKGASPQPAPRTEEHFDTIRRIADNAADGSIRSVDTMARAVDFVREGVGVDESIRIARKERAAKSQGRVDKADSPEEIARRILEAQPSGEELEKVHKGEVSYTTARELTRLTRRKPEGTTVVSGRILERGEGGRIKSGSRPLDDRTEELEEANRELSILSIQFLFLEDE